MTDRRIIRKITCPACGNEWKSSILLDRKPREFGKGRCSVCNVTILKRHPHQNVCEREECKRERNRRNYRRWRQQQ